MKYFKGEAVAIWYFEIADKEIGVDIENLTGIEYHTKGFKIHYSKSGVHIVPKRGHKNDIV